MSNVHLFNIRLLKNDAINLIVVNINWLLTVVKLMLI